MATPEIRHRQFTRVSSPDIDTLITIQQQQQMLKDRFGQFLQQDSHWTLNTLDGVLSYYFKLCDTPAKCNLSMFMIADGAHADRSKLHKKGNCWFNPHCRILEVVDFKTQINHVIFIVGSDEVHSPDSFLQIASGNGKAFYYYAVEDINGIPKNRKWTYQANSFNAFTDESDYDMSYLGPFHGHVNGACIMKEIHWPWYHWKSRGTDITQCLSDEHLKLFTELDYLTPAQWNPPGGLGSAEQLEQDVITGLIYSWFQQRCEDDFKKTDGQYKPEPANVHRWMAHLLLTTTINIATGSKVVAFATTEDNKFSPTGSLPLRAPLDLFMNSELLLQDTFSDFNPASPRRLLARVKEWPSEAPALGSVPLVKLHEGTLGRGKQTNSYDVRNFLLVQDNEAKDIYFTTL